MLCKWPYQPAGKGRGISGGSHSSKWYLGPSGPIPSSGCALIISNPVRHVMRRNVFESTPFGCSRDVKRSLMTGGDTKNARITTTGATRIIHRLQNQVK